MAPVAVLSRRRGPGRCRQGGFSLLELLVAFTIMAMSLGLLYQVTGSSVRRLGTLDMQQRAQALAESLLSARDSVDEGGWNESGTSAGLNWRVISAPFHTPVSARSPGAVGLHEIRLTVSWTDGGAPHQLQLQTLRPQHRTTRVGQRP